MASPATPAPPYTAAIFSATRTEVDRIALDGLRDELTRVASPA